MGNTKKFLHTTREVFKIYWKISPKLTLGVTITQIVLSLQGLANAYIFAVILDQLIFFVGERQVSLSELLPVIILFSSLTLVFSIADILQSYFSGLLDAYGVQRLRLRQTDFLTSLGIAQMENPELTNKSTRYGEVYQSMYQFLNLLVVLVALVVSTVVSGIIVAKLAPFLVFLFILLFILKYFNNGRFMRRVWRLFLDNTELRRSSQSSITTLADPGNVKELLISGGSKYLRKKFTDYVEWYYGEHRAIRTTWLSYEVFQSVVNVFLFAYGIFIIVQNGVLGAITVGAITFYIRSLSTFSEQLNTLSYRIARALENSIRIGEAIELFELYKPEKDGTVSLSSSSVPPTIELKNISFTYPNGAHPVLHDLSLTINPGEKIAIVGENGAGKTTLVKLVTRIYRSQQGIIEVDGTDLNNVKIPSWYKNLGVLFQDFNKYEHLTVSENVGIGRINKTNFNHDQVKEALKKADAIDFVYRYPKKFNQILSERFKGGIRPSGGQWQKLAIARFFYRNAPILILDEPTASIDAIAEAHIFDNIYKFMQGKTVIIISHRFSTVRNADRILVLDKGKIIEDGTHEELLARDGKYARSFKLQAKGYI